MINDKCLDQTCFFASSGGQPSDTGSINAQKVVDVKRAYNSDVIHVLEAEPDFKTNQRVHGRIDWNRKIQDNAGFIQLVMS